MPYVKDMLEIIAMEFDNHREQIVDQLLNWSTQAVNNRLRMAIMHRFQIIIALEYGISKAHKGGMKHCAQTIPYLSTTPECGIVWRDRMARLPSLLFCVSSPSCCVCVRLVRQINYQRNSLLLRHIVLREGYPAITSPR